jgi:hypothetical protein
VILDSDVAARSRDNFKDSLINCIPVSLLMGMKGFDWAKSNGMDNTRQRLAKSKKPINANDENWALAA